MTFSLIQVSPLLITCSSWRTRAARTAAQSLSKPDPHTGWFLNTFPCSTRCKEQHHPNYCQCTNKHFIRTSAVLKAERLFAFPDPFSVLHLLICTLADVPSLKKQELPEGAAFSAGRVFPMSFPLKLVGCSSRHFPFDHSQPFRSADRSTVIWVESRCSRLANKIRKCICMMSEMPFLSSVR